MCAREHLATFPICVLRGAAADPARSGIDHSLLSMHLTSRESHPKLVFAIAAAAAAATPLLPWPA